MRGLDDEIQVDVEADYDFAAAGRCGSRDHRAEKKRVKQLNCLRSSYSTQLDWHYQW